MQGIIKKHLIALYLNKGTAAAPDWFRIKKSTALSLSLNPETKDYDYIVDASPTTELDKYKPSINQALTMYKGEQDYEEVFKRFFSLAVGDDAKTEVLIVFMAENAGDENTFKAWKSECVISISELNAVDSTLTFDILFGGTTKKGTATVTNSVPAFSETEGAAEISLTVTVENGESEPVEGATVMVNGVEKETNESGVAVFSVLNDKPFAVAAKKDSAVGSAYVAAAATSATVNIA